MWLEPILYYIYGVLHRACLKRGRISSSEDDTKPNEKNRKKIWSAEIIVIMAPHTKIILIIITFSFFVFFFPNPTHLFD